MYIIEIPLILIILLLLLVPGLTVGVAAFFASKIVAIAIAVLALFVLICGFVEITNMLSNALEEKRIIGIFYVIICVIATLFLPYFNYSTVAIFESQRPYFSEILELSVLISSVTLGVIYLLASILFRKTKKIFSFIVFFIVVIGGVITVSVLSYDHWSKEALEKGISNQSAYVMLEDASPIVEVGLEKKKKLNIIQFDDSSSIEEQLREAREEEKKTSSVKTC